LILTGVAYSAPSLREQLGRYGVAGEVEIVAVAPPLSATDRESIVTYGPELSAGMRQVLIEENPEVLVVLGDRWELLYAVPPAVVLRKKIVHLHGGEVTEGALDDRVRNAVSMLADHHCVATEVAAERVRRFGAPPPTVHVTGAPGLDSFAQPIAPLSGAQFQALVGVPLVRPVALVTYHPPTAGSTIDVRVCAEAVFTEAAQACGTVVITWPGLDAGRDEVIEAMHDVAQRAKNVAMVEKLGEAYGSMLATVDAVIGNSSSGIIEAAAFALPVLDVGERQRGRMRGHNVLHRDDSPSSIRTGLQQVLSPGFRRSLAGMANPYGDGQAAARVLAVIAEAGSIETGVEGKVGRVSVRKPA
jgi:UDP-N-acetylglucosamine 2-epimerase (non-hydrolysing)